MDVYFVSSAILASVLYMLGLTYGIGVGTYSNFYLCTGHFFPICVRIFLYLLTGVENLQYLILFG